jgi:exonuclease III
MCIKFGILIVFTVHRQDSPADGVYSFWIYNKKKFQDSTLQGVNASPTSEVRMTHMLRSLMIENRNYLWWHNIHTKFNEVRGTDIRHAGLDAVASQALTILKLD